MTFNIKYFAIKRIFHLYRIFYYSEKKTKKNNYLITFNIIVLKKKCKKYISNTCQI